MRVTEFIHYINRNDIALGHNTKKHEYTHLNIRMVHKRARYLYQKEQRKCQNK
jgi:hypothetical protein